MNVGIVSLPDYLHGKIDGFTNLYGWWKPPECVIDFWAKGAIIPYDDAFEANQAKVLASHKEASESFISLCDNLSKITTDRNSKRIVGAIAENHREWRS